MINEEIYRVSGACVVKKTFSRVFKSVGPAFSSSHGVDSNILMTEFSGSVSFMTSNKASAAETRT